MHSDIVLRFIEIIVLIIIAYELLDIHKILEKIYDLLDECSSDDPDQADDKTDEVKREPTKIGTVIKCQFCDVELPFKARRTKDGYWACDTCKITKLNQLS